MMYSYWGGRLGRLQNPTYSTYWVLQHVISVGDRVVVVIDMESGQRFIIRCEAAIPLPALVHVLS